jgi:hypothetical protein
MSGANIKPQSHAWRIVLFKIAYAFINAGLSMLRNEFLTLVNVKGEPVPLKTLMDTIFKNAEDSSGIIPFDANKYSADWFIDEGNMEARMDIMHTISTIDLHYRMFCSAHARTLTTFEEVWSQLPEYLNTITVVSSLVGKLEINKHKPWLLDSFQDAYKQMQDMSAEIITRLTALKPTVIIRDNSGGSVLDELSKNGIGFSPNINFRPFGTFRGGIPLLPFVHQFGTPELRPILLMHHKFEDPEMDKVKVDLVYAEGFIGLRSLTWKPFYGMVKGKDRLGISDVPSEERTYLCLYGMESAANLALSTTMDIAKDVQTSRYAGNGGTMLGRLDP